VDTNRKVQYRQETVTMTTHFVMEPKWDQRFFDLADHVSQWSRDPSTKVGSCIVNSNKQVISLGFNGFPRGVEDRSERYADRTTKYKYVSHAERNALDNAFVDVSGATLYSTLFPCNECAKGIIQRGIKRIVTAQPDLSKRADNYCDISLEMFAEAGVDVVYV